jgi:glutathione S-transferase
MHSGFSALRQHCSMELLARTPQASLPPEVEADIRRIVALWRDCRTRFGGGGPFLFSVFSAADAMYAPVASRFRTSVPELAAYGDDGTAQAYVATIFGMPQMEAWAEGARAEMAAAG